MAGHHQLTRAYKAWWKVVGAGQQLDRAGNGAQERRELKYQTKSAACKNLQTLDFQSFRCIIQPVA